MAATSGVDEAQCLTGPLGVGDPVEVCQEVAGNHGCRGEAAVVEAPRRPTHDAFVHAILRRQHAGERRRSRQPGEAFEQGVSEPSVGSLRRLDGGWQLSVVADQHGPAGPLQRDPASCLKGLGRLVDDDEAEGSLLKQRIGGATRCRQHDLGAVDETAGDRSLELAHLAAEASHLFACCGAVGVALGSLHEP